MTVAFHVGDIFVARTADLGVFRHYDSTCTYLEAIAIPQNASLQDGQVRQFAQYADQLYGVVDYLDSSGVTPLLRWNVDGSFDQTVIPRIDATDPAQNPDGWPQLALGLFRFDIDARNGDVYTALLDSAGSSFVYRIWQWANDGTFIRTYKLTVAAASSGFAGFDVAVNPVQDCEVDLINSGGSISGYLARTNPCLQIPIGTVSGNVLHYTLGTERFNTANQLLFCQPPATLVNADPGSSKLRVYASDFSSYTDYTPTRPTGVDYVTHVCPTADPDVVWCEGQPRAHSPAAAGDNNIVLYQLRLSNNLVLIAPVNVTVPNNGYPIEDFFVWPGAYVPVLKYQHVKTRVRIRQVETIRDVATRVRLAVPSAGGERSYVMWIGM